jgi:hypothetical protein
MLAAATPAVAGEDFAKLEYGYIGLAAADMLTTLDIKHHPHLQEENAILGPHPSDAKVVAYFAGTTLLHALITKELVAGDVPAPIIRGWEYVTIGMEAGCVANNLRIGLRFSF